MSTNKKIANLQYKKNWETTQLNRISNNTRKAANNYVNAKNQANRYGSLSSRRNVKNNRSTFSKVYNYFLPQDKLYRNSMTRRNSALAANNRAKRLVNTRKKMNNMSTKQFSKQYSINQYSNKINKLSNV